MDPVDPQDFVCSISLELMVNPVRLAQTRQVYDHSSFHDWLTKGGTTCPLTGVRLRNPIVLVPQRSLRRRIWAHMRSQAAAAGAKEPLQRQATPPGSLPRAELLAVALPPRAQPDSKEALLDEFVLQQWMAATRLPGNRLQPPSPRAQEGQQQEAQPPDGVLRGLLWALFGIRSTPKRAPKPRPSTYYVTSSGTHVYCRADL